MFKRQFSRDFCQIHESDLLDFAILPFDLSQDWPYEETCRRIVIFYSIFETFLTIFADFSNNCGGEPCFLFHFSDDSLFNSLGSLDSSPWKCPIPLEGNGMPPDQQAPRVWKLNHSCCRPSTQLH